MAGVTIIEDNTDEFHDGLDAALTRALEKVGLVAEGYAKRLCPVDTGRLRNSITHVLDSGGRAVQVGTNVEYAPYVELGTARQKAQPYLRPAAVDHVSEYREIIEGELRR